MMTTIRKTAIDFTYPYHLCDMSFTSPLPTFKNFSHLLQPFDRFIWISILLIMTLFMTIFMVYNKKSTFKYLLCWQVFVIYMRQSICKLINTYPNNIILFTWILMSVILNIYYSGYIYSFITFPYENKIESISELIRNENEGHINMIVEKNSAFQYYLVRIFLLYFNWIIINCFKTSNIWIGNA